MYDFARGLGLKKSEARRHVVKAREFCGEEQSDSDSSSFEGEIDDSRFILETLSSLDESAAIPMAIDLPTRQLDSSDKTRAALDVPTNIREDAPSMSAGRNPPSKKRKAKASAMDSDYELARGLLELSDENAVQQAGDRIDQRKVARRDSKRERKRQKRPKIIKDDRIEPEWDTEYLNESAKSQDSGNKEGGRKCEENINYRYPSLKTLLKPKAFIEQPDGETTPDEPSESLTPEEMMEPGTEEGARKCEKNRNYSDHSLKKLMQLCSRDIFLEESPSPHSLKHGLDQTRDFCHPMIQSA